MYTLGEKKRAVELYIRYDRSCAAVIHELGYPCRAQLLAWYREYEKTGGQFSKDRYRRYSDEQRRAAVDHYLEHGRCNARTRRALGYPSQEVLSRWIDELEPGSRKVKTTTALVDPEDRQAAVIALETRTASADIIASELGVTRAQLYNWRRKYLENGPRPMRPDDDRPSDEEAETLHAQIADLRKEVDELELRKAILEGTIDLLGKVYTVALKSTGSSAGFRHNMHEHADPVPNTYSEGAYVPIRKVGRNDDQHVQGQLYKADEARR